MSGPRVLTGMVHRGQRHPMLGDGMWLQPEPLLHIGVGRIDLGMPLAVTGVYAGGNPVVFEDQSGFYLDLLIEVASIGVGIHSLGSNLSQGNWGDSAIDAAGLVVDVGLMAVPGAPGGTGLAIKAGRQAAKYGDEAAMVMTKADDVAKKMPCSFPGETEVWTPDGLVPIGRLSVGDPVLARSEESGALAWRPVLQVGSRADASLLAVSLIAPWGDDERIEATPDHPFWRADGWVPVSELAPGDRVWGAPGGWLDVDDVQVLRHTNLVFNLEVDTDHNYFVGQLGAWVHNGPCDIPGGASKGATTPRAARREAMRDAGIPTSQQPTGQRSVTTHGPDGEVNVGRQLDYEVPAPGGGTQQMSVQHSLTDDVPGHGPHWEAGKVKDGGQVDSVGRPRLQNDKAKVDE